MGVSGWSTTAATSLAPDRGQSLVAAKNIIKQQKGIVDVFINTEGNQTANLPNDPAAIKIQVQSSLKNNQE